MRLYKWFAVACLGATLIAFGAPIAAQTAVIPINRLGGSPNPELRALRPEIKTADPAQYKAVRNLKDWQNPYLIVGPEGVEVRARGAQSRIVPVTALTGVLVNLPVSAWSYGRVVAVSGPSITNSPDNQKQATDANMKAVLEMLKSLDVEANSWPIEP